MSTAPLKRLVSCERHPSAGGVPYVGLEHVGSGTGRLLADSITEPMEAVSGLDFQAGDVLFGKLRPYLAKSFLAQSRGCCSSEFLVLRPTSQLEPRFLSYVVRSQPFVEWANTTSDGAQMPRSDWEAIGAFDMWFPSSERQRAVADFLDAQTARLDSLIDAKRRMLDLAEAALRSKQVAWLTGGNHLHRHEHPQLGHLPDHWQAMRAKFCTGGITVGVVVDPSSYFVDSGVPFVHGTDVREGFIEQSDLKYLSAESNAALAKSQIRAGDIVAMRVGYPGRAAVVPAELDGANCASILIFRKGPALASPIIAEFLNSALGRLQIEAIQYGAAQGVMNVSDAVNLVLPVPPPSEQRVVVQKLLEARQEFEATRTLINRHVELLLERRQALITAVATGLIPIPGVP
jgi:type I restriction enzyme, S subunit